MLTLNPDTSAGTAPPGSGPTTGSQVPVTPLPQTTVVSSSDGTILTTKPSSQVTSNNLFVFAKSDVTRNDILFPVTTAHFREDTVNVSITELNGHDTSLSQNNGVTASNLKSVFSVHPTNETRVDKSSTDAANIINSNLKASGFKKEEKQRRPDSVATETNFYPFSNDYYQTTSPTDFTRKPYAMPVTKQGENHKLTYSTGRYETLSHRTKAVQADILPAEVGALNFDNSLMDINDSIPNVNSMTVKDGSISSDMYDNVTTDIEFNNWNNQILHNLTSEINDLFPNFTNVDNLDKAMKNATTSLIKSLENTRNDSITITEVPLSDPDRIFNVAKRILTKDNSKFLHVHEKFETPQRAGDLFDNIAKESTTHATIQEIRGSHEPYVSGENVNSVTVVGNTADSDIFLVKTAGMVDTSVPSGITDGSDIASRLPNKSPKTLLQKDFSTTKATVNIQTSVSTLKEMVSEWTREHIHDVPDPIRSTTTKGQHVVNKTSDLPRLVANSTNLADELDSDVPIYEVTHTGIVGGNLQSACTSREKSVKIELRQAGKNARRQTSPFLLALRSLSFIFSPSNPSSSARLHR